MATVIAMFSCQVLRARGDAGRVMSCRPQWCMSRGLATSVVVG